MKESITLHISIFQNLILYRSCQAEKINTGEKTAGSRNGLPNMRHYEERLQLYTRNTKETVGIVWRCKTNIGRISPQADNELDIYRTKEEGSARDNLERGSTIINSGKKTGI